MKLEKIDSVSPTQLFPVTSGALRVTDPCYDMVSFGAGTLENVKNGVWAAHVGYHKDSLDQEMAEERYLQGERKLIATFVERYANDGLGDDFIKYEEKRLEEKRKEFESRPGSVAYLHIVNIESQSLFDHEAEFDATWEDSGIMVGVDSGQAGFFDQALFVQLCSDPLLKDFFYDGVCRLTSEPDQWGVCALGAASSTGYGDGVYTCWARRVDGQAVEAIIVYLTQGEDEDEEEDDSDE